ncbi:hypothetical protein FHT40_006328 [Mycolicibacterium sp. BK556]|nr:hypothetical protein [Mycolicibacterium sp. BK556]MBB3606637.1 hypothetical protein [Mycolicibacterium sp. BK556]MBB3753744.1 hypothetical protein [Mycolicibacterium sp. BK634]
MNTRAANHYVLVGSIDGIVDVSGVGGTPVVDIRIDGNSVTNAELRNSDDGIEVTALIEQVADLHSTHLRLILPRVNAGVDAAVFAAVGLVTTELTSVGGPQLVEGPLHLYDVRPVAGTADAVAS